MWNVRPEQYSFVFYKRRQQIQDELFRIGMSQNPRRDGFHPVDTHNLEQFLIDTEREQERQFFAFGSFAPFHWRRFFSVTAWRERSDLFMTWSALVFRFMSLPTRAAIADARGHHLKEKKLQGSEFENRLDCIFEDTYTAEVGELVRWRESLSGRWDVRLGEILKTDLSFKDDFAKLYLALYLTDDETDMVAFAEGLKDLPMTYLWQLVGEIVTGFSGKVSG